MDVLTLLKQARSAGLCVETRGDQPVVKGPKRAAAIAQDLARQKAAVLAALSTECQDRGVQPQTIRKTNPSRTNPGKFHYDGKTYFVAITSGMWFFCRSPEAGWSACSEKFAQLIEEWLKQSAIRAAGTTPT